MPVCFARWSATLSMWEAHIAASCSSAGAGMVIIEVRLDVSQLRLFPTPVVLWRMKNNHVVWHSGENGPRPSASPCGYYGSGDWFLSLFFKCFY